jgi:hypothetical protein
MGPSYWTRRSFPEVVPTGHGGPFPAALASHFQDMDAVIFIFI